MKEAKWDIVIKPTSRKAKKQDLVKRWEDEVKAKFVGRTIVDVKYMNKKGQAARLWYNSAAIFILDDGNLFYPTQDDEGNGPGALATSFEDLEIVPVI